MTHWIDVGAIAAAVIVIAFLGSRALARTVFTACPPLGDWPHISDDMKHGERVRHD